MLIISFKKIGLFYGCPLLYRKYIRMLTVTGIAGYSGQTSHLEKFPLSCTHRGPSVVFLSTFIKYLQCSHTREDRSA